jgi:hypothetical protein
VRRFCSYQEEGGEWRFSGRRLLRNRGEFSSTHSNALAKLEFVRIGAAAIQFDLHSELNCNIVIANLGAWIL